MAVKLGHIIPAVLLCLATPAGADGTIHLRTTATDQYQVTYWSSEQGLPQNTVSSLVQSHDGYLWAGTRYGLARFDGMRFTPFVTELNETDTDHLNVQGMVEDASGRLWVRTKAGLGFLFEGRFHAVELPETPFLGGLRSFCLARDGGLWVARREGLLRVENGRVSGTVGMDRLAGTFGNRGNEIDQVTEDSQGALWVLLFRFRAERSWQRYDPRTGTVQSLTNLVNLAVPDLDGLLEDGPGSWWLGRPGELLRWEGGRLTHFDATTVWGTNSVRSLVKDRRGNLWVASGGPVQLHRFTEGRFTSYGREAGLRNPEDVRALLPDREGNLWVGTGSGGLHRLQPRSMVSLLDGSYSTMDEVFSVAPGRDGRVWLATTYGLVRFQQNEFAVFTNARALRTDDFIPRVRTVFEDRNGEVWFSLDSTGPHTLREGRMTPVECPDLSGSSKRWVNGFFEDRAGTLWTATQRGLLEGKNGRYRLWTTNDGLSDNQVLGLTEGADGSLWAGTQQGGVNRFKDGRFHTFTPKQGLLSLQAWPLRGEPDGSVWVGTPRGLNRIRGDEVRGVTMRDGLYDDLAYCLLEDRGSNYWSFCNRGIWRMRRADLHAVADGRALRVPCVSYGTADGMTSAEGNGDQQPNAVALPNGELWFPTTRGVVIVDPAKLRDDDVPPRVVIEEVRADGETIFKDGAYFSPTKSDGQKRESGPGGADPTAAIPRPLRLPPGRARLLEIRYTANTFINSDDARFRFQLEGMEGHDADWQDADTRRVALYTNLRPGAYHFRVLACNHHGYWCESPVEFEFILTPHFYQRTTFLVLCAVALAMAAMGAHVFRLQKKQHALRQQQLLELEAERSRIAKDLHDDLGSSLTGLALRLDSLRRAKDEPTISRKFLEDLAQSIRGMVDRMREVVWTVNPQCDTLESFSAYLCEYTENFLAAAGLRCRLDVPVEMPSRKLSAETRHHLLMVAKESLNNAARHAAATEVRLALHASDGGLIMSIADNGRGLATGGNGTAAAGVRAPDASVSGNGLANIRRRVQSLGGIVEVTGESGLGTRVVVQVPLRDQQ